MAAAPSFSVSVQPPARYEYPQPSSSGAAGAGAGAARPLPQVPQPRPPQHQPQPQPHAHFQHPYQQQQQQQQQQQVQQAHYHQQPAYQQPYAHQHPQQQPLPQVQQYQLPHQPQHQYQHQHQHHFQAAHQYHAHQHQHQHHQQQHAQQSRPLPQPLPQPQPPAQARQPLPQQPPPAIQIGVTAPAATSHAPPVPAVVLHPQPSEQSPSHAGVPHIQIGVSGPPPPVPAIQTMPAIAVAPPTVVANTPSQASSRAPTQPPVAAASSSSHPAQAQAQSAQITAAEGSSCAACSKLIVGRVINAMSAFFHPACFRCAHCAESLEHVAFFEHDGKPYCHLDYHELFSTRCFHCRTPIVDERYITINDPDLVGAGGGGAASHGDKDDDDDDAGEAGKARASKGGVRNYHEMHFFCANCGDPFLDPNAAGSVAGANPNANLVIDEDGRVQHGGKAFVVHKGYPYCEGCHNRLHKPRCRRCKQPILTDEIINALGHKWHPNCFLCESCQQPFESSSIFVNKGKAYDENCYKILLRQML